MAHECPECGQKCYCGGDIGDCEFSGPPEQINCCHCDEKEESMFEDQDEAHESFETACRKAIGK